MAATSDIKGMLLGVEFTLLGGLLSVGGLLIPSTFLLIVGALVTVFGFWVTVDTYANGADPRATDDTSRSNS